MKDYLNKEERNQLVTLAALVGFTEDLVKKWAGLKRPAPQLKALRMASTWSNKALTGALDAVREDEVVRLMKELQKNSLVLKWKGAAVREYKEMLQLDSVTPMETTDLLEWTEFTLLGTCMVCKASGEPAENCRLRALMLKYDIEPIDLKPPEGKCPYKY